MGSLNVNDNQKERLLYPLSNQETPSTNIITPHNGIYGIEYDISSPKIVSIDSNTFLLKDDILGCKTWFMFLSVFIIFFNRYHYAYFGDFIHIKS